MWRYNTHCDVIAMIMYEWLTDVSARNQDMVLFVLTIRYIGVLYTTFIERVLIFLLLTVAILYYWQ